MAPILVKKRTVILPSRTNKSTLGSVRKTKGGMITFRNIMSAVLRAIGYVPGPRKGRLTHVNRSIRLFIEEYTLLCYIYLNTIARQHGKKVAE
jgi:hypothetical protein